MQVTLHLLSSLMNGNSLRVAVTVSGSYRGSQYEIAVYEKKTKQTKLYTILFIRRRFVRI